MIQHPRHALVAVVTLFERGLLEEALELAELLLEKRPEEGRLWEVQGLVLAALGRLDLATDALEMASLLVPLRPQGRFALADCYARRGSSDLAQWMFAAQGQEQDTPERLLLPIARRLGDLGRPDLAIPICRRLIEQNPDAAQPLYELANHMTRSGYPSSIVEAAVRRAIHLDPAQVIYRLGLTALLWQRGQIAQAYQVVAELTLDQLAVVACPCCLLRLAQVYESHDEMPRANFCRLRHEQTMAPTSSRLHL